MEKKSALHKWCNYWSLFTSALEEKHYVKSDFSSRRLLGGRASRDNHPFLSPPLLHEFPFNCDTSSGLWCTAHPVISRYYLGMRGQVLPVQSMSARCTVPWPLLSPSVSVLLRSRENFPLSLDLRRSLVSQMRREFLPVRVLHAEGHPQSGRPRCKPLNYSVASRREDQTSAIEARTRSHLEIWSVLAKSNRFVMMKLEMIEGRNKERKT